MEFKKEIIIDKSIEQVWDVLGNQFGEAYKWAGGLKHSEAFGAPKIDGAVCNNRACDTTTGSIKEVIRKFDPAKNELEYEVIEGFPFFVNTAINNWKLTSKGKQTKVNMHLVIQTKGIVGSIMSPMMKMQMTKLTAGILEDFKHYVETGKPSPSKAKEMKKYGLSIA